MNNKPKFEITAKFLLTILTLLCIAVMCVSFFTDKLTKPIQSATSKVVIPLQKGINGIGLWLTERQDYVRKIDELMDENDALRAEVNELKEKNLALIQNQIELDNLRNLYKLDERTPGYTKVAARVIGKTSTNWFSTFIIDKGSNDGIEVDMNVIAGNGLVGIITSVNDNYSTVRSIIDNNSNITGMLLTSSDNCNIRGDLSMMDEGLIHLEYLTKDVNVLDGEMVVTSNISEKYLPGILIGYAKNITEDANSLTQSGYLVPAVDFKHMTEVLIITQLKEDSFK